jgi:hypothetical protein
VYKGTVFVDQTRNFTSDIVRDSLYTNYSTPLLQTFESKKLNDTIEQTLEFYPNDPRLGSPFGTGNNTFGISPGFKRMSAIGKSPVTKGQGSLPVRTTFDFDHSWGHLLLGSKAGVATNDGQW